MELNIQAIVEKDSEIKELLPQIATLRNKYIVNLTISYFDQQKDLLSPEPLLKDLRKV